MIESTAFVCRKSRAGSLRISSSKEFTAIRKLKDESNEKMLATGVLIEHARGPQAPFIDRKSHK